MRLHSGPQRLLALFPAAEVGGAERYAQTIIDAAHARGWATFAAFPATSVTADLRAELEVTGTTTTALALGVAPDRPGPVAALGTMLRELVGCWRVLWRIRPDAVLLNLPHPDQSPGATVACALFPGRRMAVIHLVPDDVTMSTARRLLYRGVRATGQRWVTVAADSAERLTVALQWPQGAVDWIPNGVPEVNITAAGRDQARASVRESLGLPPTTPMLLSVGRLSHQKGHDVLVPAIATVAAEHPEAVWVWAGDGDARAALSEQLSAAGVSDRVRMLGNRNDVDRLLLAADAFVMPSRSEGMPFALLEAMAAGAPVIASGLEPMRALIDDGVHGDLVPVEDAAALARAMSAALADPARMQRLADAARARVRERHSQQVMVDRALAGFG